MPIDINNPNDRMLLRRVAILEERIQDIFTSQIEFVSVNQVHEILATMTAEIELLKQDLISLETRVSILEDNPEL